MRREVEQLTVAADERTAKLFRRTRNEFADFVRFGVGDENFIIKTVYNAATVGQP